MFLRIYWSRIVPGAWPAIEERYRNIATTEAPGRLVRWVTQDTNDPESVITVTLWESREAIQAWENSPRYHAAIESMKPFMVGSQTVSLCEVSIEHPDGLLQQIADASKKLTR
jgi:heme-degrading monooxygenase HmoA